MPSKASLSGTTKYEWYACSLSLDGSYCKCWVLFKAELTKGVLFTLVKTPLKNFSKAEASSVAPSYLTNRRLSPYAH